MATKQKIVAKFSRYELWQIIDQHELLVEDRRKLEHLHAAARRLSKSALREFLLELDRDRLKELCRALGLDDGGTLKADIVDRLVGGSNDEAESSDAPRQDPDP